MNLILRDLGQEYCVWDALLQICLEHPIKSYLEVGTRYGDSLMRVLMGCTSRYNEPIILSPGQTVNITSKAWQVGRRPLPLDRIVIADIWHESYFGSTGHGTGFDRSHKHIERFLTELGFGPDEVLYLDGDSAQTIPLLDTRIPFDLVLVDGDHDLGPAAKDLFNCWKLVKPGGFLVFDDIGGDQKLAELFHSFTNNVSDVGASFIRNNKKFGVAVAWKQDQNLETSKVRELVMPYFEGNNGIDIGCSRDPLTRFCVAYDISEWPEVTHRGPADRLPFETASFDWVWSSHCLEDFVDTAAVLREWLRVLKSGGTIGLYVPHPDFYLANNTDHKHPGFRVEELMSLLIDAGCEIVFNKLDNVSSPGVDRYSSLVIARKV